MKLVSVTLKNFRCYQNEINIEIGDMTTLIGKNDIGKSSILEALEIFFNNEIVSIEQGDLNILNKNEKKIEITCAFSDFPKELTLDAGSVTSLENEYLLSKDKKLLKIRKVFDCSTKKPSVEVYVIAHHPTADGFHNLLELKEKDLQTKVKNLKQSVSLKGNPGMRQAIWGISTDLKLDEIPIAVSKAKEDTKKIWDQIETYLPMFALFQSDRNSKDSDDEVQDPMKIAVAAAIAEVQDDIAKIEAKVKTKVKEIADRTHKALKTIDARLADQLKPEFISPIPSKWAGLFSVGLNTGDGIPLNKRGSGVRRLILVSFFKAEAERRLETSRRKSVIYAIEEPETAQHPKNQKILIESFKSLASESGCQVILTTHSPGFASDLPDESVRFISRNDITGEPIIQSDANIFGAVSDTLGITPDSRVKVLLCVEGPTDVLALKALSKALHADDESIPNLEMDERIAFVVLGGGTLKHWVNQNYLKGLNKPEIHIYDNDVPSYSSSVEEVNKRTNGSWATLTKKYEIESYLHPDAIKAAFDIDMEVIDHPVNGKATPKCFSEALHKANPVGAPIKDGTAKNRLAEKAFPKMTAKMLQDRDPDGEVKGWMQKISDILNQTTRSSN